MDVTFLGTAGAIPTAQRNPSGIFVRGVSDNYLLDVGEGTTRQMLRFTTGLDIAAIFITHIHGDHVLGLPGLLRTMEFYDRSTPLDIFTPKRTGPDVRELVEAPGMDVTFPVTVTEVEPGDRIIDTRTRVVETFSTDHRTRSVGYTIEETTQSDAERRLVYTGDTRLTQATVSTATRAELLIHDAMFKQKEIGRARQTGHSTSEEAADVAVRAGVDHLALTHVSSRYAGDVSRLEAEAVEVFGNEAFVPRDGQTEQLAG